MIPRARARARPRRGFTFTEILIAIAVLTFGIIPLVWAIMGGTTQTRISLRQVQAANHASNLLEALRTFGFRNVMRLPSTMVQLRGSDNRWAAYNSSMGLELDLLTEPAVAVPTAPGTGAPSMPAGPTPATVGDPAAFAEFEGRYFKEPLVVPPLEDVFTRYYHLVRSADGQYVTVVVRVEWPVHQVNRSTGDSRTVPRSVELRTVLADPYRGGSG